MHAAGAALPEFKGIRDNSVAAPEGGKGYFSGDLFFSSINFISNSFLPEMTELGVKPKLQAGIPWGG